MSNPTLQGVVRVAKVLAVYALVGALLWISLPGIQRTFLLPQLFGSVARGTILAGVVPAAFLAWRYPHVGTGRG